MHRRQVTRDNISRGKKSTCPVRNEREVSRTTHGPNILYPLRPPTWKDGGPRGAQSFSLAFVFNELLRRRCTSLTTQGVALLFVSADRFVGKGTAHARFATFRGITCNMRPRDFSVMGSFQHASQDISRVPHFWSTSMIELSRIAHCTGIGIFRFQNEVFWLSREFINDLSLYDHSYETICILK